MIPAGCETWIYYKYLFEFSFLEVSCVYFVAMATNAVETTVFTFGCLFPHIAKS